MADDQKDRFIQYMAEQHQEDEQTKRAMELVLEDFMAEMKELKNQMASMQSKQSDLENQLSEERKLRESAERKAESLREKLDYARQEKFGDRRQRVLKKDKSGKPAPSEPDRQDEQDGYDGTDDTLRTDSVDNNESRNEPDLPKKERDLSNRPDGYKTMGVAGEPIEHPSDLPPIDNNLAERTIRKLTTQRNNSLHYGSDAGAEMAAAYHSVIGTVKLHGSSVWNFIGTFFKNIFNGCRDYVNMVPDKIALVTLPMLISKLFFNRTQFRALKRALSKRLPQIEYLHVVKYIYC